jgi:hypothetical protein
MKHDPSLSAPTPVIAAALRRPRRRAVDKFKRGRGVKILTDNYVAKTGLTGGGNSGNRIGAGAPRGNSNALRHGYRTAAAETRRKRTVVLFRKLNRAIDAIVPTIRAGGDWRAQCEYASDLMLATDLL